MGSRLVVYYRDELGYVAVDVLKNMGMFDAIDFLDGYIYFQGADGKDYKIRMDSVVAIMNTL